MTEVGTKIVKNTAPQREASLCLTKPHGIPSLTSITQTCSQFPFPCSMYIRYYEHVISDHVHIIENVVWQAVILNYCKSRMQIFCLSIKYLRHKSRKYINGESRSLEGKAVVWSVKPRKRNTSRLKNGPSLFFW